MALFKLPKPKPKPVVKPKPVTVPKPKPAAAAPSNVVKAPSAGGLGGIGTTLAIAGASALPGIFQLGTAYLAKDTADNARWCPDSCSSRRRPFSIGRTHRPGPESASSFVEPSIQVR